MPDAERWGGRCDLCHCYLEIGERIHTLFTPSTGTRQEGEAGTAFWAEDERWGVCDDCMVGISLLDAGSISRWDWIVKQTTKSLANQHLVVVGTEDAADRRFEQELRQGQVDHVLAVLTGFIDNRSAEVREDVNEGVPRRGES